MIEKRPTKLLESRFYKSLPNLPLTINQSHLPELLKFDLFDLVGLLPVTAKICSLSNGMVDVKPTQKILDHYESENIDFAMISIVANCYHFEEHDGIIFGSPYSYTLFPASKRGSVDYGSARSAASLNPENLRSHGYVYYGFDPFAGDWGLYAPYGFHGENDVFTDTIGFVVGAYFLANRFVADEVALTDLVDASPVISKRYRRWRIRHYFSQFPDVKPRRVWGAESPLELFLMQGLATEGLHGVPQYLFFSNGEIHPSLHDVFKDDSLASKTPIITQADIYFPQEKVAVFCDSEHFHRLGSARLKDTEIVGQLEKLGIHSVRIPSKTIFQDIDEAVGMVKTAVTSRRI